MKKIFFLMLTLLIGGTASMNAQVRIGGLSDPNPSAILDLNPDEGNATLGLSLPRVTLVDLTNNAPLSGHVKGMMVYHTGVNDIAEGVYYNNGDKWVPLYSETPPALPGTEPPVIFLRQPGFAWLGSDGSYEDTLAFELAAVDKSGFTYQWYTRDPETLASSPVAGATSDTLFVKKDEWGITEEGKVYQFYCVVMSGSQYGISGTGRAVYGVGARLAGGGWIKMANVNLGADQNKSLEEQLAYEPTVDASGDANNKAYDPIVYGDWYQWGRKKDGHENRTTPADQTYDDLLNADDGLDIEHLDAYGQVLEDHDAYGKFIQRNGGANDWRQYDETEENSALVPANEWTWGNPNNNPCLELGDGWRVPTQAEWAQIASNNTWVWQNGGVDGTSGYLLKPGGATKPTSLFLPANGYRQRGLGNSTTVGSYGAYWSNTTTSTNAYVMYFNNVSITAVNIGNRSFGDAVRCVID
jgi:uncharacterized protein (TIGR02145 family)